MATNPTSSLGMQNWYASTLSQSCGSTDTTLYITVVPSISEGYLVIDPNNTSTREVIHFTAVGAGTITIPTTGDRGLDGTNAQSHAQGTDVELHYTTSYFTALQSGHSWMAGVIATLNQFSSTFPLPEAGTNPVKFSAYRSSSQSLSSSAAKVLLDTELYDTGSNYDNATNYRFTAPVAGFYRFEGCILSTTNTGVYISTTLYKNGSTFVQGQPGRQDSGSAASNGSSVNATLKLLANDYIELWGVFASQTNATVLGGSAPILTFLTGTLVSAT